MAPGARKRLPREGEKVTGNGLLGALRRGVRQMLAAHQLGESQQAGDLGVPVSFEVVEEKDLPLQVGQSVEGGGETIAQE